MGVPEGLAPLNVNVPHLMSRRHRRPSGRGQAGRAGRQSRSCVSSARYRPTAMALIALFSDAFRRTPRHESPGGTATRLLLARTARGKDLAPAVRTFATGSP